jgi:hypothetical protein
MFMHVFASKQFLSACNAMSIAQKMTGSSEDSKFTYSVCTVHLSTGFGLVINRQNHSPGVE